MLKRLWRDERGFVNTTDLILASTILVIGMIVGLVSLRNQVVQEMSDTGSAVGNLNQSYHYSSYTVISGAFSAFAAGSDYMDQPNVNATVNIANPAANPDNVVPGEN